MSKKKRRTKKIYTQTHRASKLLVMMVLASSCLLSAVGIFSLMDTKEAYAKQIKELEVQIEKEKQQSKVVEELEEYVKTDRYVEELAREKLGMAYPNEIIFKTE